MALVYADLCTVCHQHKTLNPSGICSRCRRIKGAVYCKVCGKMTTTHESGVCYKCRKSTKMPSSQVSDELLTKAIEDYKLTLFILERRKEEESFGAIAEMCGMSKSSCYERFAKACGQISMVGGVDAIDGTYIKGEFERKQEDIQEESPKESK